MSNFYSSASKLLLQNLEQYKSKSLNRDVCMSVYVTIFDTLAHLFTESNVKVTNESLNWLAQAFYDSITINRNQELDPNIFDKRADLGNIETKELALLAVMLKNTPLAAPIVATIKRRS